MIIYEPFRQIPLSRFRDEIRFEFENLPNELFDHYILKVARHMAREGKLIRRKAIIEQQAGATRYFLQSPDGMEICALLRIMRIHDCMPDIQISRTYVKPEDGMPLTAKNAWFDEQESVLTINQPPCCPLAGYHVDLAVMPPMFACELPEVMYKDHLPLLNQGVKAQILMITGRPWTNVPLGAALQKDFDMKLLEETVRTSTHKQHGGVRMNFGRAL